MERLGRLRAMNEPAVTWFHNWRRRELISKLQVPNSGGQSSPILECFIEADGDLQTYLEHIGNYSPIDVFLWISIAIHGCNDWNRAMRIAFWDSKDVYRHEMWAFWVQRKYYNDLEVYVSFMREEKLRILTFGSDSRIKKPSRSSIFSVPGSQTCFKRLKDIKTKDNHGEP
jgi:hypothetical protein